MGDGRMVTNARASGFQTPRSGYPEYTTDDRGRTPARGVGEGIGARRPRLAGRGAPIRGQGEGFVRVPRRGTGGRWFGRSILTTRSGPRADRLLTHHDHAFHERVRRAVEGIGPGFREGV